MNVSAAESMKKLTWYIFILGKIKILKKGEDITENAFLLFATLYWAVLLSPKEVKCNLIDRKLTALNPPIALRDPSFLQGSSKLPPRRRLPLKIGSKGWRSSRRTTSARCSKPSRRSTRRRSPSSN